MWTMTVTTIHGKVRTEKRNTREQARTFRRHAILLPFVKSVTEPVKVIA